MAQLVNISGCLIYKTPLGQNYRLRFRVEDTEAQTAFRFAQGHTWALSAVTWEQRKSIHSPFRVRWLQTIQRVVVAETQALGKRRRVGEGQALEKALPKAGELAQVLCQGEGARATTPELGAGAFGVTWCWAELWRRPQETWVQFPTLFFLAA